MATIPGMYGVLPSCDGFTKMIFEKDGGKLTTDDWGAEFIVEGNIRLIALSIIEYALNYKRLADIRYGNASKITGLGFSRFEFCFTNGIEVKLRSYCVSNKSVLDIIDEIRKILEMKIFL
jgi:hypothetical protein